MLRPRFLYLLAAMAAAPLSACRLISPKPKRPLRTLTFDPLAKGAKEVVVLLPGRLSPPEEFVQFGVVDLIQKARPNARIVAPDLHLGYYMAGVADVSLRDEIVTPAKEEGLKVTMLGISMGGLGALTYVLRYPGEVHEILLLSPFVGEAELLNEIRAVGGLVNWQSDVGIPRNKTEALRKVWSEMKRQWLPDSSPPSPVSLVVGKSDKLLSSNRFFAQSILKADQYTEIEGGHDWDCWKRGAALLLSGSRN